MGLCGWLFLGGAALFLRNEWEKDDAENKKREDERNRRRAVNAKRLGCPCFFEDGLTSDIFEEFARRASRKIKRVKSVSIRGATIYCNVESQTGYTDWNFNVDFNNWGHITGTYWLYSDNDDSLIPSHFSQMISGWIQDFYTERSIVLPDLSDVVNRNTELETDIAKNYSFLDSFTEKILTPTNRAKINYGTNDLIGEHLYPVISMLKDSGFKNIKTEAIEDVNGNTRNYSYQVKQVLISGCQIFNPGNTFHTSTPVKIVYHKEQSIKMPYSESALKKRNYRDVVDLLNEEGFTNVHTDEIEDIITGFLVKDGSVESVLLNGKTNKPIKKNSTYVYNQKIVVRYHTKRHNH